MLFKVSILIFCIASIALFTIVSILGKFTGFLPVSFLYFIGSASLLLFNYLGIKVFAINFKATFPVAFALSILVIGCVLIFLSGNNFLDILKGSSFDRKDFFSIIDPFSFACIATYLMFFNLQGSNNNLI